MEKKEGTKKVIIWIIAILVIVALAILGVFLAYNSFKGKQTAFDETGTESEKGVVFADFVRDVVNKIPLIGGGGSSGGGDSGGGGGGGGASGAGGSSGSSGSSATASSTDKTICQNAQNDGLCSGLDITYGEGYQSLCCSEHNLCC